MAVVKLTGARRNAHDPKVGGGSLHESKVLHVRDVRYVVPLATDCDHKLHLTGKMAMSLPGLCIPQLIEPGYRLQCAAAQDGSLMRKAPQLFTVIIALSLLPSSMLSAEMMGTNPKPHPSVITSIVTEIANAVTQFFAAI